jgi:hypothetical protein
VNFVSGSSARPGTAAKRHFACFSGGSLAAKQVKQAKYEKNIRNL